MGGGGAADLPGVSRVLLVLGRYVFVTAKNRGHLECVDGFKETYPLAGVMHKRPLK